MIKGNHRGSFSRALSLYRFQRSHSSTSPVQLAGDLNLPNQLQGGLFVQLTSSGVSVPLTSGLSCPLEYRDPGRMWEMEWYSPVGRKESPKKVVIL